MGRAARVIGWGLAGTAGLVAVAGVAGWFLLDRVDLGAFAARRATASLGRGVGIGALHVTPGRWLRVELRDATLANIEGGTRPEMARLGTLRAEIEAWPLLHGTVVARGVEAEGLDVLLERVQGRGPNWRLKPGASPPPGDAPPRRDGSFPDLSGLRVSGRIAVRTSSGSELPVGLDGVTFTAPALDQPARLAGTVSYKAVPFQVAAALGSIAQYRDAATPFPMTLDLVSGTTKLRFEGTLTDPLNFDGAQGQLALEAPDPKVLLKVAGAEGGFDEAVSLHGTFEHAGSMWQLSQAQGRLGRAPGGATIANATLRLEEGTRATPDGPLSPDRLGLAMDLGELDLDTLLGGKGGGGKGGSGADVPLKVDRSPDMLIAAKLMARQVTYGGARIGPVRLEASQTQGEVAVTALSLGYLGGTVEGAGKIVAEGEGGRLSAELRVAGLEVQALRGVLGMGNLPLAGRLNGQAVVAATGAMLNQALQQSRASVVLTMAGGSVSREVVELGSTDARALFRKAEGMVPLSCLLGVLDVRAGVGTVSPIRLRTAEGTIAAHGTVNLVRRSLDMTVASEAATTGALALDVPVRVSGSFSDPSVAPAAFSGAGRAEAASGDQVGRLLPALQGAARASPCLGR